MPTGLGLQTLLVWNWTALAPFPPPALDGRGLASVLQFSTRRMEDKVSWCSLWALLCALPHIIGF